MENRTPPYDEGIQYLYGLQKFGIKFGLSKTSNLLESLGNPQVGQKYVHIAGTNGKGSVAAFVASILRESGLRVGLYSSPHLVRFTERFRINGREIPREEAADLIDRVRALFKPEHPPTFFEAVTAMALEYFARGNTDISVIEVGMGGRLDATNIITPLVCAITNISREHQVFLGSSLLEIAREKAGIIKKGIDVVTAATQPDVLRLFRQTARDKNARLWRVGKEFRYRSGGSRFHFYGSKRHLNHLEPGLRGKFQIRNATLAIALIEILEQKGIPVSSENIREGLRKVKWPGRMQVVSTRPLIVLDGAHNPAAVHAMAESLERDFEYEKLILVTGVMEDKDIAPLLKGIVPRANYVFYSRPEYSRAATPEDLMAKAAPMKKPGRTVPVLKDALAGAREMAGPNDLILVCGSLFTVGEALQVFEPEAYGADG